MLIKAIIERLNKFEPNTFPIAKLQPIEGGRLITEEIETTNSGKLDIAASNIKPINPPSIFFLSDSASAYLVNRILKSMIIIDIKTNDRMIKKGLYFKKGLFIM